MQTLWTRHFRGASGLKWLAHFSWQLLGTISWVRVRIKQVRINYNDFEGLNAERLYAIKRPIDFRISLQRHRLPVATTAVFSIRQSQVILVYQGLAIHPTIPLTISIFSSDGLELSLFVGLFPSFLQFLWCSTQLLRETGRAKVIASASSQSMMWVSRMNLKRYIMFLLTQFSFRWTLDQLKFQKLVFDLLSRKSGCSGRASQTS